MPKRTHQVSDSEDDTEDEVEHSSKRKQHAEKPKRKQETDESCQEIVRITDSSMMSLNEEEPVVRRTPCSYRVAEATQRASRKQINRMFAYIVDVSPSSGENIETYVSYIIQRMLANAFMKQILEKKSQHHCIVMTCCDSKTDNTSNDEQPRELNEHCVELVPGGIISRKKVREFKEKLEEEPLQCNEEQYSNVIAGLTTGVDIIKRYADDNDGYGDIFITLFSELVFDGKDSKVRKLKTVLKKVMPEAHLSVVSNKDRLQEEEYLEKVHFMEEIFADVTTNFYQQAMKDGEQWTMPELMPSKWNASIQIFGKDVPVEGYLICSEKNTSILKNQLQNVDDKDDKFTVAMSSLGDSKKLVKLTIDGGYQKDEDGRVVTVEKDRAVMAYKFGQTAVPSEKNLKEYFPKEPSHKGYVVRGWYPIHQFALYVKGGKGYRVFSSSEESSVFDSLLKLCALKEKALVVDYAYQERFEAKSGVLIPHLNKHCFIFYNLVYHETLNYLPKYDPVSSRKPELKHMRETIDLIKNSTVDELRLKYDPQTQQLFENVWKNRIDEMSRTFVAKMAETKTQVHPTLSVQCDELKERSERFLRRMTVDAVETVPSEEEAIENCIQPVEDTDKFKVDPTDFKSLF